jgi:hypothetical protein
VSDATRTALRRCLPLLVEDTKALVEGVRLCVAGAPDWSPGEPLPELRATRGERALITRRVAAIAAARAALKAGPR